MAAPKPERSTRRGLWLQMARRSAVVYSMILLLALGARPVSAARSANADDSPGVESSGATPNDGTKSKKSRSAASPKSSKSGTAKSTKPARPAGPPRLNYAFKEGQRYVYEVEIVLDLGDSTRTIAGYSTYTVKRADEDEAVLEHDGTLTTRSQSQGGRARFDPRHRAAMSSFPSTFGGRGELTVGASGAVIKNTSNGTQLPFLLGPLSTLIVEPLSPDNEPTWKVSDNLAVVGKSSAARNASPASRAGHVLVGRRASRSARRSPAEPRKKPNTRAARPRATW